MVRLLSPPYPMEPRINSQLVCSSLFLGFILVQSFFLIRSAFRLEQAGQEDVKGIDLPHPPTYLRRGRQILPMATAMSGIAYCGCNIALGSEGSQHAVSVVELGPILTLSTI